MGKKMGKGKGEGEGKREREGKERGKEKGRRGRERGRERWKEDSLRKVGCTHKRTHARTDTQVTSGDFILCPMLCIGQSIKQSIISPA